MQSKGVPPKSKIVYFKNPNECNNFFFERINPDHIGFVWGRRRKNRGRGSNWLRVAKVFLNHCYLGFASFTDRYTEVVIRLFNNLDVVMLGYGIFICLLFYALVLNMSNLEVLLCGVNR